MHEAPAGISPARRVPLGQRSRIVIAGNHYAWLPRGVQLNLVGLACGGYLAMHFTGTVNNARALPLQVGFSLL